MRSISYGLTLLLLASALGACSSPGARAPIVSRTGEQAKPADSANADPALTAAPVTATAGAAPTTGAPPIAGATPSTGTATANDGAGVQTAPVRSGGVESRSLDPRATGATSAATAAAAQAAGQGAAPITSSSLLRTAPKALKRPYTEVALAEVKAADAAMKSSDLPAKPADSGATAAAAKPDAAPSTKVDAADTKATAASPSINFDWPTKGKVVQIFAEPKNVGIVLDGKQGDPVAAAADGRVIFSGPGPRGYGNLLIVKHDPETVSVYAHNKNLLVKEGQSVKRGQKIAEVGDTGADRVGLHFEIRKQGKPIDPQKMLPKR